MIRNNTKNTIISRDYKVCKSYWSKALGLMFSFRPRALVMFFVPEQRVSLHMFFVFFPIDVLFLDKKNRVIELRQHLLPFAVYQSSAKCSFVVELPAGSISKSRTEVKDLLHIDNL